MNVPYHDPISMCTALSKTDTTVKFGHDPSPRGRPPVYCSSDTRATAYLNTTAKRTNRVAAEVGSLGLEFHVWRVGGPATLVGDHLF